MLGQNYAMELLAKNGNVQQASMDFKKSGNSEKLGFPQFKDILNGTLNKPQLKAKGPKSDFIYNNSQRNDRTEKSSRSDSNQKPQFTSYREVKQSKYEAAEKVGNKASDTTTVSSEDDVMNEKTVKTKEDVVKETLSKVLGVTTDDLIKLFKAADVNPEELTNEAKVGEAIDKLASIMNLNSEQKGALSEMLSTLKDMIQQYSMNEQNSLENEVEEKGVKTTKQDMPVGGNNTKEGWVKVNNVDITVVDNSKAAQEFKDIMAQMKMKLDALVEKLQKNPLEFKEDMAESLKASIIQLSQVQETTADGLKSFESSDVTTNTVENPVNTLGESKQDNKDESGNQKQEGRNTLTSPSTMDMKLTQVDNGKLNTEIGMQFNNVIEAQVQKGNVHELQKVSKEINVPKNEIIEQVVNKAKVVLTADKSEMVMELRPESLGKLSLKVVTERGMVVAKFVTENQQVKEALETNMQLLKDSLEKQGLSVQGFSVSVRQDSYKGMGDNRQYEAGAKEEKSKRGIVGGVNISREVDLEKLQRTNPYTWSDSQINLTA